MMLPRIGQTLRLSLTTSTSDYQIQTFKSRVADLQEEIASIELPISENTGRTGMFELGTECNVWYIGEDGSSYEFRSMVIGRRNNIIPLLLIKLVSKDKIKRTQRRNYLRINTNVEIAVKLNDGVRNYHFLARTVDLSGGGLSFTCDDSYRLRELDKINVWISLPSKTATVSHAYGILEVVRCKIPQELGKEQQIFTKFLHINESDQAKVVRACYERQLELRK